MGGNEIHDWVGWPEENLYFDFSIIDEKLTRFRITRNRPEYLQRGSELADMMTDYLNGKRVDFSGVEVRFPDAGPFTLKAWEALRGVKYGEVITYGELAMRAGSPAASRAAGHACATNQVAVVVPCHRVVSSGGIGGFGSDIEAKKSLLKLEGVRL
jgi:methylated-DNA-[protein]-cysteine S-methyltransferase